MRKINKKCFSKIEKLCPQIGDTPCFICTVSLVPLKTQCYIISTRKYQIHVADLYHPVRSFHEKNYTCTGVIFILIQYTQCHIPDTKLLKNTEGLTNKEMKHFSDIDRHQDVAENIRK